MRLVLMHNNLLKSCQHAGNLIPFRSLTLPWNIFYNEKIFLQKEHKACSHKDTKKTRRQDTKN